VTNVGASTLRSTVVSIGGAPGEASSTDQSSCVVHQISIRDRSRAVEASPQVRRPFYMLVLGDSVMWGQGLLPEHKSSYKVREWICQQRNGGNCQNPEDVQIHVEAHSGAKVTQSSDDDAKMREERFLRLNSPMKFDGEVPDAFPTIWGQVDLARRFYAAQKVGLDEVDLIVVNGGINDMGATRILALGVGEMSDFAEKFCRIQMELLLAKIAGTFPNARLIVPGYFPLVSEKTPEKVLGDTIGFLFKAKKDTAHSAIPAECPANAPGTAASGPNKKPSFILKAIAKRSNEWTTASNGALGQAVRNFNGKFPLSMPASAAASAAELRVRAFFVAVPFADVNAYGAEQTFLWNLARKPPGLTFECAENDHLKNLMVCDELQRQRPCICDKAGKTNDVACVRAGTFHPNIRGADAYFQAMKTQLEKIWPVAGWAL
jgi:lysophospholipase L1-like esterase